MLVAGDQDGHEAFDMRLFDAATALDAQRLEREKLESRFSATRKQPEKAAKKVDTRRTTKDVEVFKQMLMKLWMTEGVLCLIVHTDTWLLAGSPISCVCCCSWRSPLFCSRP
eukprot:COSAG02_NODE_683_length_18518_cov_4.033172_7_plen_112_part_00